MPTYDPASHKLLSTQAQRLEASDADALTAEAEAAEAALDAALEARGYGTLTGAAHADGTTEHARAVLAVVYQLNYQLEAGTEAEVYGSRDRGERGEGYRGGVLNPFPTVSPRALAIALPLATAPTVGDAATSTWPSAGGLR